MAHHALLRNVPTALASNGHRINAATAKRIAQAGIRRVAVSLDGASPDTHDDLRQLPGSFQAALAGIEALQAAGVSTQINCTISQKNIAEKELILQLAKATGADALHVFLLVPVGCGAELPTDVMLQPHETEAFLAWFSQQEHEVDLQLKATCAPQVMRIRKRLVPDQSPDQGPDQDSAIAPASPTNGPALHQHTRGCLAGTGVLFIDHTGEIFPCGYLPVSCGSIRQQRLADIWASSPGFNNCVIRKRFTAPAANAATSPAAVVVGPRAMRNTATCWEATRNA